MNVKDEYLNMKTFDLKKHNVFSLQFHYSI